MTAPRPRDPFARELLREPVTMLGAVKALGATVVALALAFSIVLWAGATFMHHVAVPVP